jgi:23S rRNA (adenine2030-N6)-methyltransferase
VLIDPPFEDKDEFGRLTAALDAALKKWPTGIYAIWYPIKDAAAPTFIKSIRRLGISKVLRSELHIAAPQMDKLTACGMLMINPPWRLAGELDRLLPELVELLRCGKGARYLTEPIMPAV